MVRERRTGEFELGLSFATDPADCKSRLAKFLALALPSNDDSPTVSPAAQSPTFNHGPGVNLIEVVPCSSRPPSPSACSPTRRVPYPHPARRRRLLLSSPAGAPQFDPTRTSSSCCSCRFVRGRVRHPLAGVPAHLRAIFCCSAVGLVLFTMTVVAVVAHEVVGMQWAARSSSGPSCRRRTRSPPSPSPAMQAADRHHHPRRGKPGQRRDRPCSPSGSRSGSACRGILPGRGGDAVRAVSVGGIVVGYAGPCNL